MAGTRSSARQAAKNEAVASSSPVSTKGNAGTKRKAEDSSPASAKRGRPSKAEKKQKTLEQTISTTNEEESNENGNDEVREKQQNGEQNGAHEKLPSDDSVQKALDDSKEEGQAASKSDEPMEDANGETKNESKEGGGDALAEVKADAGEVGKTTKSDEQETDVTEDVQGAAIEEDKKREEAQPSNLMEKGIIYFFTRGRVGIESPDSVQDLQRTYFVLRPLPAGAKITDGAVQDIGNNRLVALPKKVFPKSGKDRFMVFVEKAQTSMEALKDEFFSGSDYSTKTTGTRHTPDVTPIGEGVYAITTTGGGQGTTHLAYQLTIPQEVGEVQNDVGLKAKGSFVMSLKNPESSSPANAQLPQQAEYPKELLDEFRGRGWMAPRPEHLVYNNAQILLIGEDYEESSNLEPAPKDEKNEVKETPSEELEKLEGEDEIRIQHLKGDDTVFADLAISSKEYPSVMTTW